jgi:hypothetical protein
MAAGVNAISTTSNQRKFIAGRSNDVSILRIALAEAGPMTWGEYGGLQPSSDEQREMKLGLVYSHQVVTHIFVDIKCGGHG